MRIIVLIVFVGLFLFACNTPNYSGPCEQGIMESASAFNNGPFDASTTINSISWNGSCLSINLTYGGGCDDHDIAVVTDGSIVKTDPPIMDLALQHDNTDPCEALVTETISYDLGEVQALLDEEIIILNFINPSFSFTLEK